MSAEEANFSFSESSLNFLGGFEEGGCGILAGGLGDAVVGFAGLGGGLEVGLGGSLEVGLLAMVDRNRLLSLLNEEDISVCVWINRK